MSSPCADISAFCWNIGVSQGKVQTCHYLTMSDKTSPTPGPWRFEIRTEYPNNHVNGIWGPNDEEIVVTDSGYYPPTISDARLIAAAPDLLAALRGLVELSSLTDALYALAAHDPEEAQRKQRMVNALTAIAKAEGRDG